MEQIIFENGYTGVTYDNSNLGSDRDRCYCAGKLASRCVDLCEHLVPFGTGGTPVPTERYGCTADQRPVLQSWTFGLTR